MRSILAALLLAAAPAMAAPVAYELPEETAALAPGPHMDVAQANCSACHSADYITTQPRGMPNPTAFWTAEVAKMRAVYKASIDDDAVPLIVEYLVTTYGR